MVAVKNNMRNIWIIIGILIAIIVIGLVVRVVNQQDDLSQPNVSEQPVENNAVVAMFEFSETEYDFGTIKQSGGIVQHKFPFTYNGTEAISVTGVPTSCQCTSAEIDKTTLNPGDTATITVSFDPNLHAEPAGRFFKTIKLMTNPAIEDTPELKIWAEIDLDLGADAYKLKSHTD